jgi:hypothetical protein
MVDLLTEWVDLLERLMETCTLPVLTQLLRVRARPLEDKPERPRRNPARDHREILDAIDASSSAYRA